MIVLGGFLYTTSDAINDKEDGREKIKNAIAGLVIILCSYLILRTINPQFVNIPDTLVPPIIGLEKLRKNNALADVYASYGLELKQTREQMTAFHEPLYQKLNERERLCQELIIKNSVYSPDYAISQNNYAIDANTGRQQDPCFALANSIASNPYSDPTMTDIANRIFRIDNEAQKLQKDLDLVTARDLMIQATRDGCNTDILSNKPVSTYDKCRYTQEKIAKIAADYKQKVGPDRDMIGAVETINLFYQTKLEIDKAVITGLDQAQRQVRVEKQTMINMINKVVKDKEASLVTEPELLKQLKEHQATAIQQIYNIRSK
jgi:hypothetical protein